MKQKIKEIMKEELMTDTYTRGVDWNGYEVYVPEYKEVFEGGVPLVVLVKDDEVRLSKIEESFEYLKYSQIKAFGAKSAKELADQAKEQI